MHTSVILDNFKIKLLKEIVYAIKLLFIIFSIGKL
jgi:hypothetical protein